MIADSKKKMQHDWSIQKKSFKMEVFKYVKLFRSKIIKINLPYSVTRNEIDIQKRKSLTAK